MQKPDVIDEQGVTPHQGGAKCCISGLFDRLHHFLDEIENATMQYIESFLRREVTGRRLHQPRLSRSGGTMENDDS